MKSTPGQGLQTIDALWKAASGNKFGYSVKSDSRLCIVYMQR